ncbi:MAG: hydroxyacid dehydrogenase [Deltaproteobacteria bacterium]|nr:hydroxyacid dehydrogenase [Deltaproteobacteria bacterium]MBW1945529.1 hydroxyacid dehydrogenase [Deltaproteobacteria bacterium]
MKDILVTEDIAGQGMEALKEKFHVVFEPDLWGEPERLQALLPEFRAVIVRNQTRVTSSIIRAAPRLQVIGRAGAGLDNIDLEAASSAGIVVLYTPEQNSISVAELTLGMMIILARKIVPADRSTKSGHWERKAFTGTELYGKTLGIVGLGRIGYRVGRRATAFGMNMLAHDIYANPDAVLVSELSATMVDMEELLGRADYISCHVSLTEKTRGLFDYEMFCRMKPSAFFINTSRGEVVDEAALVKALKEERIAGAALDVRSEEPPDDSPLSGMDNVILTPHIGAFTGEGQERVVSSVCRDVAAVLNGKEPRNYFNLSRS